MSQSLLARRFKLGNYLGVDLFVHWSFLLLTTCVFLSSIEKGFSVAFFMVAQLLGVFFCVTLHEYGHVIAARCFGVGTVDVTLLPIGGVARLHRMPRIAWQEMIVAVAGPAVNVVIILTLSIIFASQLSEEMLIAFRDLASAPSEGLEMSQDVATAIDTMFRFPSFLGYLFTMIVANLMLVLFNMIPAFPMDGGRVLRSLVALITDYTSATRFAFRVGVFCAFLIILFSVQGVMENPIPILIALFVCFAGYSELKQVEMSEAVEGISVSDAMIHSTVAVSEQVSVQGLLIAWRRLPLRLVPIVDAEGAPVGMIQLKDLTDQMRRSADKDVLVRDIVKRTQSPSILRRTEQLDQALMKVDRRNRQHMVVDEEGKLAGILDLDTLLQRIAMSTHSHNPSQTVEF